MAWRRFLRVLPLLVAGGALLGSPRRAPLAVAAALATAFWPLGSAWRGARGTALGGAVLWAVAAITLGIATELACLTETLASGRPVGGHLTYLCTLATLAALISVLGARTPGAGAWALLMGVLVLVLLVPWLEAPTLVRKAHGLGRLRLEAPWSLFYGLLVVAGVTNYLPTRYGPAALCLAGAFVLEYLGLTRSDWTRERRALVWPAVPCLLAVAAWVAEIRARKPDSARSGLEAIWLWFRDHWGVVWALRVQERFNRAAASARWPLRLTWFGIVFLSPGAPIPESAAATLRGLIRRFATPERIDEAEQGRRTLPCGPSEGG
jgi:hypothetical protein